MRRFVLALLLLAGCASAPTRPRTGHRPGDRIVSHLEVFNQHFNDAVIMVATGGGGYRRFGEVPGHSHRNLVVWESDLMTGHRLGVAFRLIGPGGVYPLPEERLDRASYALLTIDGTPRNSSFAVFPLPTREEP